MDKLSEKMSNVQLGANKRNVSSVHLNMKTVLFYLGLEALQSRTRDRFAHEAFNHDFINIGTGSGQQEEKNSFLMIQVRRQV
ncbi:hypothetical protein KB1_00450 [Cutibacterium modestum]|uniref:Uncharacterized protein n=1 Tax=Cutibacterium modestum TaxID=2559073 RepID=A0AAD1KLT8_9ACTN|nr:hypothetical protein KB1_00450 [Cutibacterium modestum]